MLLFVPTVAVIPDSDRSGKNRYQVITAAKTFRTISMPQMPWPKNRMWMQTGWVLWAPVMAVLVSFIWRAYTREDLKHLSHTPACSTLKAGTGRQRNSGSQIRILADHTGQIQKAISLHR